MVSISDMDKVNTLVNEKNSLQYAIDLLEHDGKITAMQISSNAEVGNRSAVVNTAGMTYPQQMVDSIKTSLSQRLTAVTQQLTQLGVTDVEARGAARARR